MKLCWILLSVFICHTAFAQPGRRNSFNASAGIDLLLPNGTMRNTYGFGPGATLKGEYVFLDRLSVTASAGYYSFGSNKAPGLSVLPVMGGLRYYLGNFYLGAEAGNGFGLSGGAQNGFLYAFSFGDEIITGSNGNSLDISLRLHNWRTAGVNQSFYGLRVAYEFRLN
jgi:hypothetical protein